MNGKIIEKLRAKTKKLTGYVIWILILILAMSTLRNMGKAARIRRDIQKEKDRIEAIEEENKELEKKIAQTQGVDFIEKEIRNKLGLVKSGEAIVVLPDEETLRSLAPKIVAEQDILPDPNWKKWIKLFM